MKKKLTFDYSWVIIGLSILMVFTVLGFCSSAKSIFIVPICDALGVSRSAFSLNDSLRYIATSFVNIFFGILVARFGIKKLIMGGFISLIISSFLYSIAPNIYVFYLGGIFLGIGIGWTTTSMVGAIVNRWCKSNRGTITGLILASNGLGASFAMQVLTPIIYNPDDPFGYRTAYKLICFILLGVALILLFFFKDSPKEQIVPGNSNSKKKTRIWEGLSYDATKKKWYFYATILCIFTIGMVLQGITGVAAPLLKDAGLSAAYVANVLSMNSLILTGSKFLAGFSYDKFGLKFTSSFCTISAATVMLILSFITNSTLGKILAVFYAILSPMALPLETVLIPIFASDLFGEKSNNKVLGILTATSTAGFAVGTPLSNLCYDATGNYNMALYIAFALMIVVFVVLQFIIKSVNKEKQKIGVLV